LFTLELPVARSSFNSNVSARTRAANFIRTDSHLLDRFLECGGLESDLVAIAEAGRQAEAANLAQSGRLGDGKAATVELSRRFAELQREYKRIMNAVRAVKLDLTLEGADAAVIGSLQQILIDETAVSVTLSERDGKRARDVKRSSAQEAIRAEIHKDAAALLELAGAQEALASRKVTAERLTRLRDDAAALSGQLAVRVAKKAERKSATEAESAAVKRQVELWSATRRLLRAIDDPRVDALLAAVRR
jgi:hypothetical protein